MYCFSRWNIHEDVNGDFDHRKPYPDDNDIQFEIKDGTKLSDWIDEINELYRNMQ